MKISSLTIDIKPRNTGELIDLAFLFYRVHFFEIVSPALLVGIPIALTSIFLMEFFSQQWLFFLFNVLFLFLITGVTVTAAGPIVFGTPMSAGNTMANFKKNFFRLFISRLVDGFVSILLFPLAIGYVFKLNWAFSPMILILEQLRGKELKLRLKGLAKRGGDNNFGFDISLISVIIVLLFGLMAIVNLMTGELFTLWPETGLLSMEVFYDPVRLAIWMVAFIIIYPIYSLGWFFKYLDARIRAEGWDLELDFKLFANRLDEE